MKHVIVLILTASLLHGCGSETTGNSPKGTASAEVKGNVLDTTILTLREEESDDLIKFYSVDSNKIAAAALPFKFTLPEELPFESKEGLEIQLIRDILGSITASYKAVGEDTTLTMNVSNINVVIDELDPEEVKLTDGSIARYVEPDRMDVRKNGVTYSFILQSSKEESVKESLIQLAETVN